VGGPEADAAHVRQLVASVVASGGRLWVLDVGLAEVVNVIWKYYHRRSATLDEARQMPAFLWDRPVPGLTADEPLWRAVHGDFPQIHLLRNWSPGAP
jgi:hypothetical protein